MKDCPPNHHIAAVLIFSDSRFSGGGGGEGKGGGGDTAKNGGKTKLSHASAWTKLHKELFLPQKCGTCSVFSVRSQLVCSVNKVSELIGDLKKLEGKGLALKQDLWLAPNLNGRPNWHSPSLFNCNGGAASEVRSCPGAQWKTAQVRVQQPLPGSSLYFLLRQPNKLYYKPVNPAPQKANRTLPQFSASFWYERGQKLLSWKEPRLTMNCILKLFSVWCQRPDPNN